MDPMRDLSISDSRSDSSSSPPLPSSSSINNHAAQTLWPQNLGDSSFQFSSMMYPITSQMSATNSSTSTPLQSTSSNPFDFSSAAQQYSMYQSAAAASYNPWAYQAAYNFPPTYAGIYASDADFKNVTLPITARSSAATTPTATLNSLPWTMTHEGKKKRQPYKKDQISRLEYEYTINPYLTNKRRAELSIQLMLDEKQVKVWFQNRRMKDKKLKQRVSGPFPLGAPVTPCIERLIN